MHPFEMTRELVDLESITENEKQMGEYLLHYLSGLAAGSDGKAEAMIALHTVLAGMVNQFVGKRSGPVIIRICQIRIEASPGERHT